MEAIIRPNWSREFTVLGRHTLEQLSEIILQLLGWNRNHLYEFRIAERVYAHIVFLGEDALFVEAETTCVSCDIPIRCSAFRSEKVLRTYSISATTTVFVSRSWTFGLRGPPKLFRPYFAGMERTLSSTPALWAKLKLGRSGTDCPRSSRLHRPVIGSAFRFILDKDGSVLRKWRASNNKTHWQKAVTILESRNLSPKDIATKIERAKGKVEKWIQAFNRFGLEGLKKPDGRKGPRKSRENDRRTVVRDQKARRILEIFHAKPSAYGINRSNWNRPSIVRAYKQEHNATISESRVGDLLRQFGYSIRKARKVLTSPDPNYREKVDLLLNTLHNLKLGERFFFVDELGPLRVKKYGGRALVRKNEVLTYPQEQKHRGVIMMSGALSATTNQVTWAYGSAKGTTAIIDLLELLYNQFFSATKLYVTWDAVSWHKSTILIDWLNAFNSTTRMTNEGPLIELVPLPTSSQFLDVIEAVFSGMKRAVVHHSDYPRAFPD
jgi:transposase